MTKYLSNTYKITKYLNIPKKIKERRTGGGGATFGQPLGVQGAGNGEADSGLGRRRRLGAAAAKATVACGHFEMRQRREGKRSAGGLEAEVYSSVATWALPRIFINY
jgi:hypothetical protein